MAKWLTAPFESADGKNIITCTIREDVAKFRKNHKYKYMIEVEWKYQSDSKGMPISSEIPAIDAVSKSLDNIFNADPIAVITGIYMGDGIRTWIFYTLSLPIFQRKFNEALSDFPDLPLKFKAYEDPAWDEYSEIYNEIKRIESYSVDSDSVDNDSLDYIEK